MQITDAGMLIRAGDATNTNEVSTLELTDEQVKLLSTNGTASAGLEVSFEDGASLTAYLYGTDSPAVTINGRVDNTSTSGQGVLTTGSGQGNSVAPTNGNASWADVQMSSANYGTCSARPTALAPQ